MQTNPKENRTPLPFILIQEFRRKGYKCEEIREGNSTIFIMKHEKKDPILQAVQETYKIFKAN